MGLGSGIGDPRSRIWDPEKTFSGSRIQGSKRYRIPDPGSATLSASLCSLAGRWSRYDNPLPIQFLAPIDCFKLPALKRF